MSKKSEWDIESIFVSPGEKLGVIEEYLSGNGTYVDNGNIYSSTTGELFFDKDRREIEVHSKTSEPLIPVVGDIILGEITSVQDKNLTLRIFQIRDKPLAVSFTGIMHISDVGFVYIKTMYNIFKIGDLVRARVISTKNREFHLSTKNEELGVIEAVCIHCGAPLIYKRKNLRCLQCSRIAKRKLANDYMNNFSETVP